MKKIIALTVAITAITAQAASFDWGTGTSIVQFNGERVSATGYLVLLSTTGSGSVANLFTVDYTAPGKITGATSVREKATTDSGFPTMLGKITGSHASTTMANDEVYGMYIQFTNSEGTWFNFSSDTYKTAGIALGNEALDAATFSFNFGTKTEITAPSQAVSAGGGWYKMNVAVPEPSTAALALAGLALLIKRRRA